MLSRLKELKNKIREMFEIYCPDCGGILKYEFYNPIHKVDVFRCQECGKEWV